MVQKPTMELSTGDTLFLWMVDGKTRSKMDDDWGYPQFRKPPFIYPLVICYIAMEHGP
jgi:hypothetical protein